MLLNGGTLDGRRYLSAAAMKFFATPQTGELPTGFFQNDTYGNRGANYGWGIATSILRDRTTVWPECCRRAPMVTAARGALRRRSIPSRASPTC